MYPTGFFDHNIRELETFQCDHCDYQVNCQVLLRKHMDKEHKLIPQLDGLEDSSSKELDPCLGLTRAPIPGPQASLPSLPGLRGNINPGYIYIYIFQTNSCFICFHKSRSTWN